MATIQEIKTKLLNANKLGRTNLAEKGVELPETATTYEIMSKIAEIVSGGGTEYTSIVYNADNTITLTDKDGVIHTMSCTYEDGKLISATYDGKAVDLTYNGDALVKVGKTAVDIANAPATSGATFNIAYGETAPEDTSKLWIKANEPANVSVGSDIDGVKNIAQVGALPTNLYAMGCTAVGTKIYLFGGSYDKRGVSNAIRVFNTETKELTTLDVTLPTNLYAMGCAAVGTKIYLFGGFPLNNTIQVFDLLTKTFITLDAILPTTNSNMGCTAVGTDVYLFGGGRYGDTLYSTIQKLSVTHELAQGDIEVQSTWGNNKFNLINTENNKVEIGVENVFIGNTNNEAELCEAYLHNGTEWVVI